MSDMESEKRLTTDKLPFVNASIRLDDGRVARVVHQHHASPIERWQMWKTMRAVAKEAIVDGAIPTRRRRLRLYLMFLGTILDPNCQACYYEFAKEEPDG